MHEKIPDTKFNLKNIFQFVSILSFVLLVMGCIIGIVVVVSYLHDNSVDVRLLQLPQGFKASVLGKDIPMARQVSMSPKGITYVGTCTDSIYSILMNSTKPNRIISNLTCPAGISFFEGNLYVLQNNSLVRFDSIEIAPVVPVPVVIYSGFPNSTFPKYLKIGPDRRIYVSVGTQCNSCFPNNTMSATIVRMELDGSNFTTVASGVRSSQGLTFDSLNTLWFTDVSKKSNLYDYPVNELNKLTFDQIGEQKSDRNSDRGNYGFPYCYGTALDILESGKNCTRDFVPPVFQISPQVAPYGVSAYSAGNFPTDYSNSLFIAEHGSLDLPESVGFRVMHYNITSAKYTVFIDGWISYNIYFGRPTDVVFGIDGSMLISDDYSGSIYQVVYSP
jgi:glucose/arabinose dehydrogenase